MSDQDNRISRRDFVTKSGITALGTVAGLHIVNAANLPEGVEPIGFPEEVGMPGKSDQLVVLNNKPWNAETPPHLLDDLVTPKDLLFVRNNGHPPVDPDPDKWVLTIDGESASQKKTYTIAELKQKFKIYSYHITLECGGNGREEFNPAAKGNQWTTGAVGCCKWTGVRLSDVLKDVGVKSTAVYIGYYGADTHLSGDSGKVTISRGVPIAKAMEPECLIAWAINDEPIPLMNGFPLRLVIGGWPGSVSGKWLNRISVRNKVHDGPKMEGYSYRMPKYPVEPGTKVPEEDMEIIESMPVKSLITYPRTGAMVKGDKTFEVRGHAWAGDLTVKRVELSMDFGSTWKTCTLSAPKNRFAWQRWVTKVSLPDDGYYELWVKATDTKGNQQPMVVPGWNPKGYLNNACHRIAVKRI